MRIIDYHIAVTLDGFICHENGSVDGFLMEGAHADEFVQSLENYDTVLMGGKTYEFGYQFGLQPGQPVYPNLEHYVFSRSLNFDSSEFVTLVRTNVIEKVNEIRKQSGQGIWLCGGAKFAGYLLNAGMIDKLTVKVNPVVFGSGRKLFEGHMNTVNFDHISSKVYENGVVLNKYHVNKNSS